MLRICWEGASLASENEWYVWVSRGQDGGPARGYKRALHAHQGHALV